ncbi:hypothetical protein CBG57_11190 [Prevotella nigrescens]|uniref:outer membrane beta-barrel family protein n=1 Tax=Prevotella nigrescens TaxID=28133 RepID=UPI000B4D7112|nr:outer membrane beta-barrel family protein [Prevotella nigrescens]OWP28933.1 hypothetical protein CBG57_11190 [Prevotella nigrescens]
MQNKPFSSLSLFFLFFFAFGFPTHGQNLFGKVTSGKTSIEYCNVILRQASDSLFISGTVTDSMGMFSFNKVKEGKYFVEISCLGYAKKRLPVSISAKDDTQLNVMLEPSEILMKEATVTATRKMWKKKANSIVMNVEGTPLANMFSPTDVLSYMPGVMADASGIRLMGKDNMLILIDNRMVRSFSEVENLPVKSIKSIAIERNAGVKYDSKYTSILRIATKKWKDNMAVELIERTQFGRKLSHREGMNVNWGLNKLTASLDVTGNFRNSKEYFTVEQQNTLKAIRYFSQQTLNKRRKGFDLAADIKYEFGESHYLQIHDDFYTSTNKPFLASTVQYLEPNLRKEVFTNTTSDYRERNNRLNLFYNVPIISKGRIEFSLDYIYQSTRDKQAIEEISDTEKTDFPILYNGQYHVYLAKLNYTGQFFKWIDGSVGADFMTLRNHTLSDSKSMKSGLLNGKGRHTERQFAYYVNLQKQIGKILDVQAGVRNEFVRMEYTEPKPSQQRTKRLCKLFPFFSLSLDLSPKWSLSFAFDRKMNLPSYQELNPIITYFDRYSYRIGNPALEPVCFNNLSFSVLYDHSLNIYAEYSFIRNQILEVPTTDNEKQTIRIMPINLARSYQVSLGASLSRQFGKHRISISTAFLAQRSELKASSEADNSHLFTSLQSSISYVYQFIGNADFYVRANYTGQENDAISRQSSVFGTTAGMNFRFFRKRLQLNIAYNNLLCTKRSVSEVIYASLKSVETNNADKRIFSVSLKYNINAFSRKNEVKSIDDILRRL